MRERKPDDDSVILECDLPAPPAKVWRALTEPDLLARWLLPGAIRAEPGHRFTLQGESAEGGRIACEVLAAEPGRRLSYSWRGEDSARDAGGRALDTVVTFELCETPDGGTHLRLVHDGFMRRLGATAMRRMTPANSNLRGSLAWAA
jgi:uncharacterized protein YndB with AHSA1/START domain